MKGNFATYEIALKLKELGFNDECLAYFNSDEEFIYGIDIKMIKYVHKYHKENDTVLAPLWVQVIDWLATKNLRFTDTFFPNTKNYGYEIYDMRFDGYQYAHMNRYKHKIGENIPQFDSKYKAYVVGINKALEIIKTNKGYKEYYDLWVGLKVYKKSKRKFKSGRFIAEIKSYTTNSYSGKPGFLIDDGTVVDCYMTELFSTINKEQNGNKNNKK